ncbi:PAS domain-containing protein [Desulforhopalus vacuolatus]|uniref:two-component system sensor histidine kinase NtrB n=1 Tax=Desulforhopalus vacuolatus TaxID=40414 RepID=UPI0019624053|nr:ATP-binding protein [Desulforhopalus vacuolatus]MBM9519851.1 PAS domain-containing protein [Desulforhopalus vacuolatus]
MIWTRTPHRRRRLLEYSPWILGVAWMLLFCLLAFFAVSNYQREKALINTSLEQKGLTAIRMVNYTAREEIRRALRSDDFSAGSFSWKSLMTSALDLVTGEEGVLSARIVDLRTGQVLVSSMAGSRSGEFGGFNGQLNRKERMLVGRVHNDKSAMELELSHDNDGHFMVAAPHRIAFSGGGGENGHNMDQMRQRKAGNHADFALVREQLQRIKLRSPMLLLNLDYGDFSAPLKRQFLQIILQVAVIVLVGIGGVLSFLTVQGVKQAEKGVADLLAFMERLVVLLPVGLIATDRDGRIRICNRAATDILGNGEQELLGQRIEDAGDGRLAEMMKSAEKTTGSLNGEVSYTGADGHEQVVNFLSRTVNKKGEGESPGEVIVLQDMTEVKQLEKDLHRNAKLAAVGKMAAGVAHEIRNPLSSIKGLALLLGSRFDDGSEEAGQAATLVGEVDRLNRAIGELLDFSRPTKLEKSTFNLPALLQRTVQLVEQDAKSCGVQLILSIPAKLKNHTITADQDKLSQVFLNLLLNALQAFDEKEGDERRIELNLVISGNSTIVTVHDSGSGIAGKDLNRVIDPYFTTKSNGTGLGLALSAKIVEEHGGRLELESEAGRFTEVRVIL